MQPSRIKAKLLNAAALFVACSLATSPTGAMAGAAAAPTSATTTATATAGNAAQAPAQKRPRNVIFILLDDLRYDGMGFLQPQLKTPNIDRLAKGGTYFPNAVVTSSLCSPSRATILTGQSVRNHGIVDNNGFSEDGLVFFPKYLQGAGYRTGFFGKWHMGADNDLPRDGFDKWVSFKGQGNYFPTPDRSGSGKVNTLDVDGKDVPQKGYITDELTDYALDWLKEEKKEGKPFFLYLSHKAVHSSATPPERYRDQYRDATFTLPDTAANTPENYQGKPLWVYNQRNSWHGVDNMYNSSRSVTDYQKEYYATLSAVDDSLGRIWKYLKDNGLEKDTMIVFTSDNGFLMGEHGLIDKRNAYEASVKIPLVVYAPGLVPAGKTNTGRIRNLDFAPTFLDLANVPQPSQFEGKSALPLITGRIAPTDWKPGDFVYEYFWEWNFPQTPGTFAIERDRMKYIQYYGIWDTEELYNLADDPDEKHNLIADPAFAGTVKTLRKALFDQLGNTDGKHQIPFTARTGRGSVYRVNSGTTAAQFPKEWLIPPRSANGGGDGPPPGFERAAGGTPAGEKPKAGSPIAQ